jgi:hypothetical protein
MTSLLAIDLGCRPALCVVSGTWRVPEFVCGERFSAWDTERITASLRALIEEHGIRDVYVEQTFTWKQQKRRYLADVGRVQESQAGFLKGWLCGLGIGELRRVTPVNHGQAYAAWYAFGSPEEGKGGKGEHLRDALGIALRALMERDKVAA